MYRFFFPEYNKSYIVEEYREETCPKGRVSIIAREKGKDIPLVLPKHLVEEGKLLILLIE